MSQTEEILQAIAPHRHALRQLGVNRLGVFGSFARGEGGVESDVDILVDMGLRTADAYFGILHLLEAATGRKVDLVMTGALKAHAREQVLAEVAYLEGY